MIEIKSWRDGKVLYAAKNAKDVREAVEGAARENANLRFADLRSADLRFADLRSADLGFADLGSADLRFADLRSANLGSADLRLANLRFADLRSTNLGSTNLRSANLGFADLRSTNLRFADLRSANLGSADLRSTNLRFADLRSANLGSTNLRSTTGLAPERSNPLLLLADQVGKIRAYKLVTADLKSPIRSTGKVTYEIGSTVKAKANTNPLEDCGPGINLATLPWCLQNHSEGNRILICEFTAKDIAAIPNADGKFRVHKAKVIKELDLTEMFAAEKEASDKFQAEWDKRKDKHV